jgi:AcrR family transcriptional regulator
MAATTPARRERRNRDAEVVDAAVQVFWKRGYAGASVQEIADIVGVLKGSLYHYFGSKEELLARIFQEAYEESEKVMASVSDLENPPLDRLRIYLDRYIKHFLDYPERAQLYFRDWRYLTGPYLERVVQQRRTYNHFVRVMIEEARDRGEIDSEIDTRAATSFILGAIHNIAEWYRKDIGDTVENIAKVHSALAVAALRGYRS